MQWLDIVLKGGLPRGRLHEILGPPGAGKTTLGLQFLLDGVYNNESCLFVTLAQTEQELLDVAASHEMDLTGITIVDLVGVNEGGEPEQDYTALDPAEVELGESFQRITEAVKEHKPKRVVIDSMTELSMLAHEPVRFRRQVMALKQFLMSQNCTTYLIAVSSSSDAQMQTLCHGVIEMDRLNPEYGKERRQMRVVKMRGVEFHGGYHDYDILKGGLVVWPRLVASNHRQDFEREPLGCGVPELDHLLAGGLDRGTTGLIIGPSGVGKSSVCKQYAKQAAERGEYFVYYSFDERLETLHDRAMAMGLDLKKLEAERKCSVEQIDPGSISPGEFMQRVQRHTLKFNAKVVIIDSLNGYLAAMPGEKFLIIQMHEMLTYLSRMGVLSLIVISQHGILATDLNPPIDLSYLADAILFLRYFEHGGEVRRALSVVKKRGAPHEHTIRELKVIGAGIDVGEPLEEFEGVLSREPRFIGRSDDLMESKRGKSAD